MKKTHVKIGSMVREYREKMGMTQHDLAMKLGYDSPQFVSLFERGHSKVPFCTLGHLISLLGIPEKTITQTLMVAYEAEVKRQLALGKKRQ